MKHTIHLIAAARPNFMKIAPLYHELSKQPWANPVIVHTGQHYDPNMSDIFFNDLGLPSPHIHLGVGSGSHAEQTGNVMIAYEKILLEKKPTVVVVAGDVNSTIACTLAASKIQYSDDDTDRPTICHLEAGLRSFDRTMPEEINRLATDVIADILWTPSPDADEHLLNEGIDKNKIVRVGNIMIDSLEFLRSKIETLDIYSDYGVSKDSFAIVTLHRPANVDNYEKLSSLCDMLIDISEKLPVIMPVHPRTKKSLDNYDLFRKINNIDSLILTDPLSYMNFMNLVFNCKLVITDSGGIQEETTYLGKPCFTLRPNTERPITITQGTNQLCKIGDIPGLIDQVIVGNYKTGSIPDLWDGKTASRIAKSLIKILDLN